MSESPKFQYQIHPSKSKSKSKSYILTLPVKFLLLWKSRRWREWTLYANTMIIKRTFLHFSPSPKTSLVPRWRWRRRTKTSTGNHLPTLLISSSTLLSNRRRLHFLLFICSRVQFVGQQPVIAFRSTKDVTNRWDLTLDDYLFILIVF